MGRGKSRSRGRYGLGLGSGLGSRLRGLWLKVATRGQDACVFAYMQQCRRA